jgi:uncharacterized protein YecT (DUF1311 family)
MRLIMGGNTKAIFLRLIFVMALPIAASCDAYKSGDDDTAHKNVESQPEKNQQAVSRFTVVPDAAVKTAESSVDDSASNGGDNDIRKRAPKGINEDFFVCVESAGNSSYDISLCMTDETKKQDARLNAAYKNLMVALEPESQGFLKEAQRAWLRLGENESRLKDRLYGGGAMSNLTIAEYELFSICSRANELEAYLEDAPKL